MRKFLTPWLIAAMLLMLAVSPAVAKGPKCANVQSTNAAGDQNSRASFDGATDEVAGQFFLAADSCRKITYTLVILDDEGDSTPIAQASVSGDGTNPINIFVSGVTPADSDVCAYVVTSRGTNQFDRAPADGCVILLDDGTSPGGGKGF